MSLTLKPLHPVFAAEAGISALYVPTRADPEAAEEADRLDTAPQQQGGQYDGEPKHDDIGRRCRRRL